MTSNRIGYTPYLALAVTCITLDLATPPWIGLPAASVIFLIWSIVLSLKEYRRCTLRLNPIVAYQVWLAATLGISTLWTALHYAATEYVPFGSRTIALTSVARGHAAMIAGACALYFGMRLSAPTERPLGSRNLPGYSLAALVGLAGMGGAAYLFRETLTQAAGSTITNFIGAFPLSVACAALIHPPSLVRAIPGGRVTLSLICTALLLVLYAHRDSKMDIMFAFFPILWWLMLRRVSVWVIGLFGVTLCLLYLLIVAPLVTTVRDRATVRESGTLEVWNGWVASDVLPLLTDSIANNSGTVLSSWLERTMSRLCDACAAGAVAEIVDRHGLEWGRRMGYVVIGLIPRMFWKDKPELDRGRQFSVDLGMASSAEAALSSTGETSPGELYWNFGWPGVVVGMFVLGIGIGGIWWGAAGGDPRTGILEMTAYTAAMLAFVNAYGSAAGSELLVCVISGLLCRSAIYLRDHVFKRGMQGQRAAIGRDDRPAVPLRNLQY